MVPLCETDMWGPLCVGEQLHTRVRRGRRDRRRALGVLCVWVVAVVTGVSLWLPERLQREA